MENVSLLLKIFFILITFYTVGQFYAATTKSTTTLIVLTVWMLVQALIGFSGFYTEGDGFPPRIALLGFPALVFIVVLFTTTRGRAFLDSLNIQKLTFLHTVRVAVELALYFLFLAKAIPLVMTFDGWNYDILAGLSAPIVYYYAFIKKSLNNKMLLVWNIVCLLLLFNIVSIAVLSAPTVVQKLAFEQPNIAILYFPFVWLPSVVVPLVLLSHLASIRRLLTE